MTTTQHEATGRTPVLRFTCSNCRNECEFMSDVLRWEHTVDSVIAVDDNHVAEPVLSLPLFGAEPENFRADVEYAAANVTQWLAFQSEKAELEGDLERQSQASQAWVVVRAFAQQLDTLSKNYIETREQLQRQNATTSSAQRELWAFKELVAKTTMEWDGGCADTKRSFLEELGLDVPTVQYDVTYRLHVKFGADISDIVADADFKHDDVEDSEVVDWTETRPY